MSIQFNGLEFDNTSQVQAYVNLCRLMNTSEEELLELAQIESEYEDLISAIMDSEVDIVDDELVEYETVSLDSFNADSDFEIDDDFYVKEEGELSFY